VTPGQLIFVEGEPIEEWHGIPIMAEAVAGDGTDTVYTYSIYASFDEIESFYDKEMVVLGWERSATGTSAAGQSLMLIYMKNGAMVLVALAPGSNGLTFVVITG
jgi:hypothetical protein